MGTHSNLSSPNRGNRQAPERNGLFEGCSGCPHDSAARSRFGGPWYIVPNKRRRVLPGVIERDGELDTTTTTMAASQPPKLVLDEFIGTALSATPTELHPYFEAFRNLYSRK